MTHTRETLNQLIDRTGGPTLSVNQQRGCLSLDCDACEEGVDIGNGEHDTPETFANDHKGCSEWIDYSQDPWMSGELDDRYL